MQETRGRLVHIPQCVLCAYVCLRECGQPVLTSRGLDMGRVLKITRSFCPRTKAVVEDRALSGEAVQFVCSNCNLPRIPCVPHKLFVAVQIPLTSPIAP